MTIEEKIEKYLNQDINNPRYLFHGSPKKLDKIIPNVSYDYTGNRDNIANAVFLFPSLIKASAYAFKDTIKNNSEGLKWHFDIPSNNEYPVMVMENVNIDENIIGYIYVFDYDDKIRKDDGDSLQYKLYEEFIPIDIVPVCYKNFKEFYCIKRKSEFFELEYSINDKKYIDDLFLYVEEKSKNVSLFFDIDKLDEKVYIKLFDDLDLFRESSAEIWRGKEIPTWLCGLSFRRQGKDYIYTLSLDEYRKTDGHHNCTIENLKLLIVHEFVHACHRKYSNIKLPIWIGEGLATFLSHQYDGQKLSFDSSLEQIKNGGTSYANYYIMLSYALNNYGRDYILKLLKDEEYLEKETIKLYNEVSSLYKNKNR